MEQMDEKLLKAKKQMEEMEKSRHSSETIEEELKQSIYDEQMTIYKIPVQFKPFELMDGKMSIYMPQDFNQVEEEVIAQVYPLGNKPQYVFSNGYLYFSIGFSYTQQSIPNEQMKEFSQLAKVILERVGPKAQIYEAKHHQVGDDYISTLTLITQTLEQAMYNQMFFCSLEGRLLIGFINFPAKYNERLKPLAKEIVQSFKIIHKEEEA